MTRVLVVLKYAPPGSPQDQQRGNVYEPMFTAAGIDVQYVARYPMWAMARVRSLTGSALPLTATKPSGASRRIRRAFDVLNDRRILAAARSADVVYLVKTDSSELVHDLRRTTRARIVYDLADIRGHDPREAAEMEAIVRQVDAMTVDNGVALDYVRRFGKPAFLFPPLAYVERFDERRSSSRRGRDGRLVIGWMGTPSTASNLYQIFDALEDVFRGDPTLELRLLGVPVGHEILSRFEHVRVSSRPTYDAGSMVDEVLGMDIGLFPQYESEHAAMHGLTKGLIYMAGGAVVVASAVGEVSQLIRDDENGLLAAGRHEWAARLRVLAGDAELRARLAEAAIRSVRETNSIGRCFTQLRAALDV